MGKLYLRKVIVTILPQSGKEKILDELHVTFRCEKTLESTPNTAQVDIYNLSEKTRSILEGKKTRLILEAGYEETVEVLFQGNITDVTHERQGPDIISKIEVADGGNHFRNARIEKGMPPGTKTKQVIDELIKAMDLPRGSIDGIPDSQYANGITLTGFAKDRLNDVTRKNNLEWSIQNEAVQIIPRDSTTQESEIRLAPNTGLIGRPSKTKEGIQFVSLLQPKLMPGRKVRIESDVLKGVFKIAKVTHAGDNQSGDFTSVCESKVPKAESKAA